ncbi:uncharacterized protein LOC112560573 isoform X2 [Pomacea canaliculata]|uniref:uncharacterized protein LOC112560573 isoform X2 n=1 Tax=Pomacea canaliculata TaxID=400727 RepID=UPI000D72A5ED|nr:uncharacterized protein LOC112560573 isoform X2 [Pomacea canaliculata]
MIDDRKISSFLKMQRSYLLAVFIQMLLEGLPCSADRACEFNDSKFFIGDDDKAEDVSAGECSFGENFCGYSVTCTDKDATSWSSVKGQAVSQGKNGKYEAFSVLLSPLLNIEEEMCLEFNYSQSSPGRLSVFLATSEELVYIKPEELGEGNFSRLTNIKPSVGKIGFRARSPNEKQNVSLWDVSLVKGPCRSVPACSSGSDDILLICAWNVEQDASTAGSGSRVGDRYSGIIAGTLLFLVVVIVIFLVGFFHWRKYVKQESRNKNDDNKARVVNDSRNPVTPAQRNPAGGHRSYETMHRSEGEDNHAYEVVDVADVRSLSYLQNVVRKEREHNNSNTAIYEDSLPHKDRHKVSVMLTTATTTLPPPVALSLTTERSIFRCAKGSQCLFICSELGTWGKGR